jgi:hypothetical protein
MTEHEFHILVLWAAFLVKHYWADFPPLQTTYMIVGKNKPGLQWIVPLMAHCAVHATLTAFILAVMFSPAAMALALVDFIVHFFMDRLKSLYQLKPGVWSPEDKKDLIPKYYAAFGLDQLAHGLTYVLITYLALQFL